MGSPLDTREEQVVEVLDRLYDAYPDTTISLNFSSRLELLVAVMLSAQCTDERVNKVTADLFEKYHSPEDYVNVPQEELAEDISSITYYNNKSKWIQSACRTIIDEHDGAVPDTMEELTDLTGVGRKTANVVLQHAHDVVEGIVVDTHVQRISRRLGITEEEYPEKIEQDLMTVVPEADWQQFTHLFISHGRATCTAINPDCSDCVLEGLCPSSKLDHEVDLASGESWT
ncbi:DNA-(apurinic or apyrimidinic site) lyase /endonuclease III [Halogranum amylolyticum]|uniref:Endonuclease III n=1 Tax=Halogranum amylolyticum TaxID=660520 RepID=A0A1H8PBN9_9EURY|nr:endonuclease III [Halogranum amylolyticum]SEO39114.1 DNA-(apurinic or apyrimidinic site) lyase /endonuclease III [Halogranum amylolyticum]